MEMALKSTQCKGTGANSVDHFNGKLMAGGLCRHCRGKREILCGNCNGAGFMGRFMSTLDEFALEGIPPFMDLDLSHETSCFAESKSSVIELERRKEEESF